jgi:hypothetical protein
MPDFLAWFPAIVPVREQFGFRVTLALADREHDTFTWAVELDGDPDRFREVEATYLASPERAAAFETFPDCLTGTEIGLADDVLARTDR